MKVKIHKFLKILAVFAFVLFMVFSSFIQAFIFAYAEDSTETKRIINFDETAIEDDLTQTQMAQFSTYTDGIPRVVSFMEYCYSPDKEFAKNYGLYAYVFNPSKMDLHEFNSYLNLCVTYDMDGTPQKHEKSSLVVLDKTNDNVLYKFKIENAKTKLFDDVVKCAEQFNGERRYDISTLVLFDNYGNSIKTDINKIYSFNGQASQTGSVENNTLFCQAYDKLNLKPQFANYRTGIDGNKNNFDGYICDEINTAYFSVPKKYFDNYGSLEKITAEWDEYKTSPIFVTNDEDFESEVVSDYIGKIVTDEDGNPKYTKNDLPWRVLWEEGETTGEKDYKRKLFNQHYNGLVEGNNFGSSITYTVNSPNAVHRMDWFFHAEGAKDFESFCISKEKIESYAMDYDLEVDPLTGKNDYSKAILGAKGWYNQYLFDDSIDTDRIKYLLNADQGETRGYMRRTIDAKNQETQDLLNLRANKDFWDLFWHGAKYKDFNFNPIEIFTDSFYDFKEKYPNYESFNNEQFVSNRVNVDKVYNFCLEALKNDEYPVLFRFAVTDYYVSNARFDKVGNGNLFTDGMSEIDGYVSQETVFLNFDVISLAFRLNGQETLIPAVMDPVDLFNGVEPNPNEPIGKDNDDWDWLMDLLQQIVTGGILALAVVLFVALLGPIVFPLVGWLFRKACALIVWIIKLPSKLIRKLFKRKRK